MRWSIASKTAFGFSVSMVMVLALGGIGYWSSRSLLETSQQVTHTNEVLRQMERLLATLSDMETGQRGFVITETESFLEPYEQGLREVDGIQDELRHLTADNPRQQRRLQLLGPLIELRQAELQKVLELMKSEGVAAAAARIREQRGKKHMDDIRRLLREMEVEEQALLKERSAEADETARRTLLSIGTGTGLAAVIVVVASILLTRSISRPLRETSGILATNAAEILAATSQQASGVSETSAAVAETVATIDEVAQTAEQAAERAQNVAASAQRVAEIGRAGRKAVETSIASMAGVRDQVESISERIFELVERAKAIGEIVAAIDDIAEQTNLLALNAAIESARAGEHGRGFSVVAAEVRRLAEQSKKATVGVRQILGEIQGATTAAVKTSEQGSAEVKATAAQIAEAGETIRALAESVGQAAQSAAQIVASAGQQAIGMHQIRQAMENIRNATQQNLASTRQMERAARGLNGHGTRLVALVGGARSSLPSETTADPEALRRRDPPMLTA